MNPLDATLPVFVLITTSFKIHNFLMRQAHITLYFQCGPIWWSQQLQAKQYSILLLGKKQPAGGWLFSPVCMANQLRPATVAWLTRCPLTPNLLEGNGDWKRSLSSHPPVKDMAPAAALWTSKVWSQPPAVVILWYLFMANSFWELFPPKPNAGYRSKPKISQVVNPCPVSNT